MNADPWDAAADGGALRIHYRHDGQVPLEGELGGGRADAAVEVAPRGDTLVLFRADRVLHEVLPARAQRVAATMWFHAGSAAQRERLLARTGGVVSVVADQGF